MSFLNFPASPKCHNLPIFIPHAKIKQYHTRGSADIQWYKQHLYKLELDLAESNKKDLLFVCAFNH